jgi:valyl-tRNA synthetase
MKKAYEASDVEDKWNKFWHEKGFFKASSQSDKKPYTIILPPPNITGHLHMGHALVNTLQDIMIRLKRMQGFEALWLPGVDHAGIATQSVVEKHLFATTGKRRSDFSREEFLKHTFKWKDEHQDTIIHQLKLLGCSCDWDRLSFTMDERSSDTVQAVFKKLFDDGLIYQGNYLVNWDTVLKTAIADDEVEHEEKSGSLYYMRYPLKDTPDQHLIIATTRPETMLGDVAVAVNPQDDRYKDLVGKQILLPITNRAIPIIADNYVTPEFGSGAVKITPAHDFNDYEIGQRHKLESINIMNEDGTIIDAFENFAGLTMLEARARVIDQLTEESLLEKIEPHTNRIGLSYRSKAVVEPFLSKQWFIKMEPFKKALIETVKEDRVKLLPKVWQKTYFYWIDNLRDWCISRQLWWGHRIPIYFDMQNDDKPICVIDKQMQKKLESEPERYRQDSDVLDTWFSSALWPFSTLDWLNDSDDFNYFYPNSTLITGYDILFFWVARMIMMGTYVTGKVPFHETFIHGLIFAKSYWTKDQEGNIHYCPQDERMEYELGKKPAKGVSNKWEKMSKSKGNGIDPLAMIKIYGTDATRFTLAYCMTATNQIDLDTRKFEEFKNFSNKLFNASSFIFMHTNSQEDPLELCDMQTPLDSSLLTVDDNYILMRLKESITSITSDLENYHFEKAARTGYSFFWNDFCSKYLELCKPYLFDKALSKAHKMQKKKILVLCLCSIVRLLHPIIPFITEEIFSLIRNRFKDISKKESKDPLIHDFILAMRVEACVVANYPKTNRWIEISDSDQDFVFLDDLVYAIRNIRAEMQIAPRDKSRVLIHTNKKQLIESNLPFIEALVSVEGIEFVDAIEPEHSFAKVQDTTVMIPMSDAYKQKELERLLKMLDKERGHTQQLENKLGMKNFIEKAPKELVLKTKEALSEKNQLISELEAKVSSLS